MRQSWVGILLMVLNVGREIFTSKLDRVDCIPERVKPLEARQVCQARGCVWDDGDDSEGAPKCYFDSSYGYNSNGNVIETKLGQRLRLTKITSKTMFGNDLQEIDFDVEYQTKTRLRFTFSDIKKHRYKVPVILPKIKQKPPETEYFVNFTNKPFSLTIFRKGFSSAIWDSSLGPVIFSDQYLQISTRLPSKYLYGFGEQEHDSFLHQLSWQTKRLGMFTRDQFPFNKDNLYGVHPFYICLEENGKAHGVFFLNSNAMDVQLQPTPGLTYRTIGGILDFFVFMGPTPEDVVKQYTEFIGRTFLPPYWSLGFQLSRWGYNSLKRVQDVVDGMTQLNLPQLLENMVWKLNQNSMELIIYVIVQDVQYGDIDYMKRQLDFTYDNISYGGLPEYVTSLKDHGIRYIIILDPAISANETGYTTFDKGTKMDVWIKDKDNRTLFGKVWPDYPFVTKINRSLPWDKQTELYRAYTTYPDFFKSATTEWWTDEIREFYKTIKFDGLWIDMNEPSNFVKGSVKGCENNTYNNPPYLPWLIKDEDNLIHKTICMDSIQDLNGGTIHYNVHSLYGWSQSIATVKAAQEVTGKRSVVISRSTFAGSGKNAGHWLGDNKSSWDQLHYSIIGMLEFNLFGIPYIGADICGFFDNATPDLCARWMQLGAFYPFSRNHNSFFSKPQDPASFGKEFAELVRPAMNIRYSLLPYLYTLFYQSHTTGSTVVRPLMHEFTDDKTTWKIDKQFLWGAALLITPVLEKNKTSVRGYLPQGRWFDFETGKEQESSKGWFEFDAPHNAIVLHLRGGFILPIQAPANNTAFSRRKPMKLLVSLDKDQTAKGQLFWDDGDSLDTIEREQYYLINFQAKNSMVTTTVVKNVQLDNLLPYLDVVNVYGVKGHVTGVTVNNKQWKSFMYNNKVLVIQKMKLDFSKANKIQWTVKTNRSSSFFNFSMGIVLITFLTLAVFMY